MHPFPAEHDQQQAAAIEILRHADAFLLVNFRDFDGPCDNPLCFRDHEHRTTTVVASCSSGDLTRAIQAIGEEVMLTQAIEMLMGLSDSQRDQIAGLLRHEENFLQMKDDEE